VTRVIDSYSFGQVVVNEHKYTSDVIIFPDRVRANWWRKAGHSLHPEDIGEVIEAKPEVLVVGTGASGVMDVPEETRAHIKSKGIELIAEPTEKACETFNRLSKSKKVVAALHLTC